MACEHRFEQRRPIEAAVDVVLTCPSCESDRVRRRFSVFAAGTSAPSPGDIGGPAPSNGGGCCGGGGCACGH
jgi:putative FmdB family regulatory protein